MIRQSLLAFTMLFCLMPAALPAPQAGAKHQAEKPVDVKPIDVDQLKKKIDAGEKVYLLDVRRPDELQQEGMIKGAINIPIDQLEARMSEVPKDKPLTIYCHVGGRANRAAGMLREKGYTQPIEYGGIQQWKAKQYPVDFPSKTDAGKK